MLGVIALLGVLIAAGGCAPESGADVGGTPAADSPSPRSSATIDPEDHTAMHTIVLAVEGRMIEAELFDNATAGDLLARLPLTVTFRDFNAVEKVGALPDGLTMSGVPQGDDPEVNDLGYYAPSGALVLYYGEVGYWNGIVRLGRIAAADMAFLQDLDDGFEVTIEVA